MLKKYFESSNKADESSIMESFVEHAYIDGEEVTLLYDMVMALCDNNRSQISENYKKIVKISEESDRDFEIAAEYIIQTKFNHQKQYDLLRLHQRIITISGLILAAARRIVILNDIEGQFPTDCNEGAKNLIKRVKDMYQEFINALNLYQSDKTKVLKSITEIEAIEHQLDTQRAECLKTLYQLANKENLKPGDFRAIENIYEYIEETGDAIEAAATSLEWLLLN